MTDTHPLAGTELTEERVLGALRHGILCAENVKLFVGGELRMFQAGDIVPVKGADAAKGSELVQVIASLLSIGTASPVQVFVDKKALEKGRKKLQAAMAKKAENLHRRAVGQELDAFRAKGGQVSKSSLERLLGRAMGGKPADAIARRVWDDTLDDFGFGGAK